MDAKQPQSDVPSPERPSLATRLRAGLTPRFWKRLIPIVGVTLLVLSVPVLMREAAIRSVPIPPPPPTVADAWAALARRDWVEAKRLAGVLREDEDLKAEELGAPAYVLGLAAIEDAEQYEGKPQVAYYTLAAKHFAESQARGFPPEREVEGLYLLGKSLFLSQQMGEAREPLDEALQHQPEQAPDIHRMLSLIHHRGAKPNLKLALEHNTAFLATPSLAAVSRNEGWLRQGRILFELNETTACQEALDKIPTDSRLRGEVHALRGRLFMREAAELQAAGTPESLAAAKDKYQKTIDSLRLSLGRGNGETAASREALYLMGICLRDSGDERGAIEQFGRLFRQFNDTEEGIAAGFQQAELLRKLDRVDDALGAYDRLIRAVGLPEKFLNQWLTIEQLRDRLLTAVQGLLLKKDYERVIRLAELAPPVIPLDRATQISAQAYRSWAGELLSEAEAAGTATAGELRLASREKQRRAGERFAKLADLRFATRSYPDDLWDSLQSSLAGRDYEGTIVTVHRYLRAEDRRRRAAALLILGEAQLAQGRPQEALAALRECLSAHGNDPASYKARILAARALTVLLDRTPDADGEKADQYAAEAERLLQDNLLGDALTPASLEYRDSLFAYGKLMHERGVEAELTSLRAVRAAGELRTRDDPTQVQSLSKTAEAKLSQSRQCFNEAVVSLENAVARYPNAPQTVEAKYLVAETYRRAARAPREQLAGETIDTARARLAGQIQHMVEMATAHYEQVQDILNQRQENAELTANEQAILRNAYFFHGSVLVDAGRYPEALRVYSTATDRYQDHPEVLQAYLQIAYCNWQMRKLVEFHGTISQALTVLEQMRPDAKQDALFKAATNLDRNEWTANLKWLSGMGLPAEGESFRTARNP